VTETGYEMVKLKWVVGDPVTGLVLVYVVVFVL
jgi:hypothetical protein